MTTILIVDDDAIISMIRSTQLQASGYSVVTTLTGERAVQLAVTDRSIGLVLMDIDLGAGIDGPEAARRILALRRLPIVFHSSHSEPEYVDRVKEITRYGYVVKSSGEFVLRETVAMALELFAANERLRAREHELAERVKELDCLFNLETIAGRRGISELELLEETARLLPAAWQYPELTSVRIMIGPHQVTSPGFREPVRTLEEPLSVEAADEGTIWIGYSQLPSDASEDPFLPEERRLLRTVARRVGGLMLRNRIERRHEAQQHALDSMEHAVITTDLGGRVRSWSAGAERIYGWRSDEAIGRNIVDLTVADIATEQAQEIVLALGDRKSWSGTLMARDKWGREFPIHATDSPIYGPGGALEGLVAVSAPCCGAEDYVHHASREDVGRNSSRSTPR